MKITRPLIIALSAATAYALSACGGDGHGHSHDAHVHKGHDHKGHDHDKDEEHTKGGDKDHDHDHDHDHDPIEAGPNGGRILTGVEPHAEFFVTDDRKVQITFVDDDEKTVPVTGQSVNVVTGDRSNQTKIAFAKSGDVLLSEQALPDGMAFPVIVQIKTTPESKSVIEKFNLDLNRCPTCKFKEYACDCEHDH